MHVDLDDANLFLSPDCQDEAVQSIALSFVTSMLYLMVLPYPQDPQNPSTWISTRQDNTNNAGYSSADDMAFLAMCGWSIRYDVPSNSNYSTYGTVSGSSSGGCGGCRGCGGGDGFCG